MEFQFNDGVLLGYPREQVFEFFSLAENLNVMTPPWARFSILTPLPIEMAVGTIINYRIELHRVPLRWESEITEWEPPLKFTDVQRRGPYKRWVHEHIFEEAPGGTLVTDRVTYEVTGGALVNRLFVARELRRIFAYRKAKLLEIYP